MLSLEERDPTFGNKAVWGYIAIELTGENDCKAVLHYLIGETRPLVCMGTESIQIVFDGARELLLLLRNNYEKNKKKNKTIKKNNTITGIVLTGPKMCKKPENLQQ